MSDGWAVILTIAGICIGAWIVYRILRAIVIAIVALFTSTASAVDTTSKISDEQYQKLYKQLEELKVREKKYNERHFSEEICEPDPEPEITVATKTFHENDFNAPIAYDIGGEAEHKLDNGLRVDCLTDTHAYEVEWGNKLYEGIGQALTYAYFTRRKPGVIVLIGEDKDRKRFDLLKPVLKKYKIKILVYKVNKLTGSVKFMKSLSDKVKEDTDG